MTIVFISNSHEGMTGKNTLLFPWARHHCLVLVGSRKGFKLDLTIKLKSNERPYGRFIFMSNNFNCFTHIFSDARHVPYPSHVRHTQVKGETCHRSGYYCHAPGKEIDCQSYFPMEERNIARYGLLLTLVTFFVSFIYLTVIIIPTMTLFNIWYLDQFSI